MKDQFGPRVAALHKPLKPLPRLIAQTSIQNMKHNRPIRRNPDQSTRERDLYPRKEAEIPARDKMYGEGNHADGKDWQVSHLR